MPTKFVIKRWSEGHPYIAQYSKHDRGHRTETNDEIIKYLKLDNGKPKHILDLGCGLGDLARQLMDQGHSVVSTQSGYGWEDQYLHAKKEMEYYNIKIHEYTYDWGVDNSSRLENLKSLSNKKYDMVIAKRFAMHCCKNSRRESMIKEQMINGHINAVEAVSAKLIYESFMGLVKQLKAVCKSNATIHIGFCPQFTTHEGYGSPDLLKYADFSFESLGQRTLKFNLKTIK